MLLPGVERRSSVADLQARQAAGRGAANSAAGQGGQRALRASGLQSGRRTCDDRYAGAGYVETADEGHALCRGDRSRRRSCRGRFLDRGDGSRGGACGDVGQHLFDAAAELRAAGYDRDARLVLRGAGRRTGCGARRTAAHAGVAALRRAGRGTGRVCDAGLPARSRAGDRGADQQGRTVEQEEEARPLRDADDRAAVALLVAGADRQGGTVRAQRLRLPRQHALRAASRSSERAAAGGDGEGRARFVPRGGDAAPRACAGAEEALHCPGPVLHRAARADRHAEHPHRHGVCHASQTPRIHTARASAGRTHVDGRADQGGRGRNHPRLHRKDAGNIDARNEYSLPTGKSSIYA